MDKTPRAWMFTAGLALVAIVAACFAPRQPMASGEESIETSELQADSCVRYGRFECCVREE